MNAFSIFSSVTDHWFGYAATDAKKQNILKYYKIFLISLDLSVYKQLWNKE